MVKYYYKAKGGSVLMTDNYIKTIQDAEGNQIVIIDNIKFSGKRRIDWDEAVLPIHTKSDLRTAAVHNSRLSIAR